MTGLPAITGPHARNDTLDPTDGFRVGDKVAMTGYDEPDHIFYGIVAKVLSFRQFQMASTNDWYWNAFIGYEFLSEPTTGFYPVRFLQRIK